MKVMDAGIIMIVCIFIGVVCALFGGMVLDETYYQVEDAGLWNGLPSEWTDTGTLFNFINLYYIGCTVIPFIGIGIFVKSWFEREGTDRVQYYG